MPKSGAKERWECPKCDYFYLSPLAILGVSHRCQSKNKLGSVALVKVREYK